MKFFRSQHSGLPLIDRAFAYVHNLRASDRLIFSLALFALFVSAIWSLIILNNQVSVSVPASEGTIAEGIVGTPRFVNPVLAATRADRDLSALVYSGLARLGEDGTVVPDIAESITVSADGLVYNVILRPDVFFHDGTSLTSEDVAFTISRIQDPQIGSPLRASWDSVSVEILGTHELNFVLSSAYAPFIENLTVGILPRHIWKDAGASEFPFSQYNSEPIGSGPYSIREVVRDASGIPKSYVLTPHAEFHRELPKIQTVVVNFYTNEQNLINAWNERQINSVAGLSADAIEKLEMTGDKFTVITTPLPRTFAVFFNQNKSAALRDSAARNALNTAIDRENLIEQVFDGYAEPLESPIPPGFGVSSTEVSEIAEDRLETARTILRNGGWTFNATSGAWEKEIDGVTTPLTVSISTANATVFGETAEYLRAKWGALGVQVSVKQFEQSDLTQAVIRPRDYEALLFGTVLGRALGFYSFWHSSQRNDPGLNVALYANITTDGVLETARTSTDSEERALAFQQFEEEITKETPAVFLYSPLFTYIIPNTITSTAFTGIAEPHERFAGITDWYVKEESVWPLFKD